MQPFLQNHLQIALHPFLQFTLQPFLTLPYHIFVHLSYFQRFFSCLSFAPLPPTPLTPNYLNFFCSFYFQSLNLIRKKTICCLMSVNFSILMICLILTFCSVGSFSSSTVSYFRTCSKSFLTPVICSSLQIPTAPLLKMSSTHSSPSQTPHQSSSSQQYCTHSSQ
jgi:hypothetical protein